MKSRFIKLVEWYFTHKSSPVHLADYIWQCLSYVSQKYWSELCEKELSEIFSILNQQVANLE